VQHHRIVHQDQAVVAAHRGRRVAGQFLALQQSSPGNRREAADEQDHEPRHGSAPGRADSSTAVAPVPPSTGRHDA
jgi:hypothetical protein